MEKAENTATALGANDQCSLDYQLEQLDSSINGLLSNIEVTANVAKGFLRPPTPKEEDEDVVEESLATYSETAKIVKRFIGRIAQANYQLAELNNRFDQGSVR
jgi:hypothetical protein